MKITKKEIKEFIRNKEELENYSIYAIANKESDEWSLVDTRSERLYNNIYDYKIDLNDEYLEEYLKGIATLKDTVDNIYETIKDYSEDLED